MPVLLAVASVLANIAGCGVQTCNVTLSNVLQVLSWEFLETL